MKSMRRWVHAGETERVEFKQAVNDGLFNTLAAFASNGGGTVLLGVADDGRIIGVEATTEYLERLINRIVSALGIYPKVQVKGVGRGRVIFLTVTPALHPVSYEGRYYQRVGNTTREMTTEQLKRVLLHGQPWDAMSDCYSVGEISVAAVRRFIALAAARGRLPADAVADEAKVFLQRMGLCKGNKITNAAGLLFGKSAQKRESNCCVRIGRFRSQTTIIDDKWVRGNLLEQIEGTLAVLKQHIAVRYRIRNAQREELWDYPLDALREAVVNALVHRDYFDRANIITIKVFDDHIWFHNPGGLPPGITIEQLKQPHASCLRNPLLAKMLYLVGEVEQYGSGTVRMLDLLRAAGLPEPEYREEFAGFSIYFRRHVDDKQRAVHGQLNARQVKAVEFVRKNGAINNQEYCTRYKVSKALATLELRRLVEEGKLVRTGKTGKGTRYVLPV